LVPITFPTGGGVDDGLTEGLIVFNGLDFADGTETGEVASALLQIQLALSAVDTNATTTNTNAPTNRGVRVTSPRRVTTP
jgi:hypothetical protein